MRLLTAPFDPSAHVPSALVRPLLEVALIAAGSIALLLAADTLAGEWRGLGRAAASGGSHAAMIAAGWVIALGGAPRWRMPAAASAAALIVASVAARLAPAGAVLYFLVPLVLARQAGSTRLDTRWIGWARPQMSRQVILGVAVGGFLGLHLLLVIEEGPGVPPYIWEAAKGLMTHPDCRMFALGNPTDEATDFGEACKSSAWEVHTASVLSLGGYLAGVAYDVGANALSVGWLFHGALFSALWRRWTFWPAAAIATGAGLLRYLVDPTFPTAPEAAAGAVFYLTILGLASCALRAWTGSVLPGYLATLAFFAAYRALHV